MESTTLSARAYTITLCLTLAATALFVATGGAVFSQIARSLSGWGLGPDRVLRSALFLNIALIILSWRRHRALGEELAKQAKARLVAEQRASDWARTDQLTGFPNRAGLEAVVSQALSDSAAGRDGLALLKLVLNDFDHIRDCHGSLVYYCRGNRNRRNDDYCPKIRQVQRTGLPLRPSAKCRGSAQIDWAG